MKAAGNAVARRTGVGVMLSKRPIQICPIPDCKRLSKTVSRHLVQYHKISVKSAGVILNLLKADNRNRNQRPIETRKEYSLGEDTGPVNTDDSTSRGTVEPMVSVQIP